jgi:very-short-patch-repair endonuclease
MAAVLSCGPAAALSHGSAAVLWEISSARRGNIDVSVPVDVVRRIRGISVHRRSNLDDRHRRRHRGVPVTSPACTLVDLAASVGRDHLERAINEADKRDLISPEGLRRELDGLTNWPGAPALRRTLDRRTFTLTDSRLERLFLPIARQAGLQLPLTRKYVSGYKVDFYWPDLGLVVETDGLRYHRTPAEQARDRVRDQVHTAAGLTPLRFTRAQVRFEPDHVLATLRAVARRLAR